MSKCQSVGNPTSLVRLNIDHLALLFRAERGALYNIKRDSCLSILGTKK